MSFYFVIAGCGSIGRRHLRLLKQRGVSVSAFDTNKTLLQQVADEESIPVFSNLDDALKSRPDALFVCTPPLFHIPVSLSAAKYGIHLFIEKPLAGSMEGVDTLIQEVKQRNLVAHVGCNLRFMKSLKKVKQLIDDGAIGKPLSVRAQCGFYLPYWRPGSDYRQLYSARKESGGGVILDNIHEIDYLLWMFGKPKDVFCRAEKTSSLEINTEDLAEISLSFSDKLLVQIHFDYLQKTYRRSCEFIGEKGLIVWDYIEKKICLYSENKNEWTVFAEDINTELNQMYSDQLEHFLRCLKREEKSCNDVEAAKFTLQVVLKCRESAKSGRLELFETERG